MRLSEFANYADLKVIREGEFSWLSRVDSLNPEGMNLIFLERQRLAKVLDFKLVSSIIVKTDILDILIPELPPNIGIAVSEKPKASFYKIHIMLAEMGYYRKFNNFQTQISPNAIVSDSAKIAPNNVTIGDNTYIGDFVVIGENVHIGKNCVIQPGVVIGTDCLEVAEVDGRRIVVPHVGSVIIEDDVTILSGATITKGLFPHHNTVIGNGCVISGRTYISHGVHVGKKTIVSTGTVISGSTKIGESCWIGPGSVISNGLKIGNDVRILIGSVVVRDVPDNTEVAGNFAIDSTRFLKFITKLMLMK